jgi:ankyrin repeat protein
MYAAELSDDVVLRQLLELGAELNATSNAGATALHYAARGGKSDNVAVLVAAGCNPVAKDKSGRTALKDALGAGLASETMTALLNPTVAHANAKLSSGLYILVDAAMKGHQNVVAALANARAHVDARHHVSQRTPLMHCVERSDCFAMTVLLEAGADTALTDVHGKSAASFVAPNASPLVHLLLRSNERIDDAHSANGSAATALMLAATWEDDRVLSWLLRRGANVALVDALGDSALHYAARAKRWRNVARLLGAGAQRSLGNKRGETAAAAAAASIARGDDSSKKRQTTGGMLTLALLDAKRVNDRNAYGETPLHVCGGHLPTMLELLAFGADVRALDDGKRAPILPTRLDLSGRKLRALPRHLDKLTTLTALDVSDNELDVIPASLGSLPKLVDLRTWDNDGVLPLLQSLASLDYRAVHSDGASRATAVLSHLRDVVKGAHSALERMQLNIVGDGEVGKSQLIAALKTMGKIHLFRRNPRAPTGLQRSANVTIEAFKPGPLAWVLRELPGQPQFFASNGLFVRVANAVGVVVVRAPVLKSKVSLRGARAQLVRWISQIDRLVRAQHHAAPEDTGESKSEHKGANAAAAAATAVSDASKAGTHTVIVVNAERPKTGKQRTLNSALEQWLAPVYEQTKEDYPFANVRAAFVVNCAEQVRGIRDTVWKTMSAIGAAHLAGPSAHSIAARVLAMRPWLCTWRNTPRGACRAKLDALLTQDERRALVRSHTPNLWMYRGEVHAWLVKDGQWGVRSAWDVEALLLVLHDAGDVLCLPNVVVFDVDWLSRIVSAVVSPAKIAASSVQKAALLAGKLAHDGETFRGVPDGDLAHGVIELNVLRSHIRRYVKKKKKMTKEQKTIKKKTKHIDAALSASVLDAECDAVLGMLISMDCCFPVCSAGASDDDDDDAKASLEEKSEDDDDDDEPLHTWFWRRPLRGVSRVLIPSRLDMDMVLNWHPPKTPTEHAFGRRFAVDAHKHCFPPGFLSVLSSHVRVQNATNAPHSRLFARFATQVVFANGVGRALLLLDAASTTLDVLIVGKLAEKVDLAQNAHKLLDAIECVIQLPRWGAPLDAANAGFQRSTWCPRCAATCAPSPNRAFDPTTVTTVIFDAKSSSSSSSSSSGDSKSSESCILCNETFCMSETRLSCNDDDDDDDDGKTVQLTAAQRAYESSFPDLVTDWKPRHVQAWLVARHRYLAKYLLDHMSDASALTGKRFLTDCSNPSALLRDMGVTDPFVVHQLSRQMTALRKRHDGALYSVQGVREQLAETRALNATTRAALGKLDAVTARLDALEAGVLQLAVSPVVNKERAFINADARLRAYYETLQRELNQLYVGAHAARGGLVQGKAKGAVATTRSAGSILAMLTFGALKALAKTLTWVPVVGSIVSNVLAGCKAVNKVFHDRAVEQLAVLFVSAPEAAETFERVARWACLATSRVDALRNAERTALQVVRLAFDDDGTSDDAKRKASFFALCKLKAGNWVRRKTKGDRRTREQNIAALDASRLFSVICGGVRVRRHRDCDVKSSSVGTNGGCDSRELRVARECVAAIVKADVKDALTYAALVIEAQKAGTSTSNVGATDWRHVTLLDDVVVSSVAGGGSGGGDNVAAAAAADADSAAAIADSADSAAAAAAAADSAPTASTESKGGAP